MKICVVIPAFRVAAHITDVLDRMPDYVDGVCVVDDACPDHSGDIAERCARGRLIQVLRHSENQGVGGAVLTGYRYARDQGFDIAVKVDGDGQMDPALIESLAHPIVNGQADYTKGTRFFSIGMVSAMPPLRLFGNAALSFASKATSGYWGVMDPTNGFTAIHTKLFRLMPFDLITKRFFFESDMLYHLGLLRAVVVDVPMFAKYENETSNLKIRRVLFEFPSRYVVRMFKRFLYNYILRDFNVGSITAILGTVFVTFGTIFGGYHWWSSVRDGAAAPLGTIMVAALPMILGTQLLIASVLYDVANQPRQPIHPSL